MSRTLVTVSTGVVGLVAGAVVTYFALSGQAEWCAMSKHHCIVVTVDAANTIDVETDPLGKKGKGHTIRWIIPSDQAFSFPANGIVFAIAGEFRCPPPNPGPANPHVFECDDPNGTTNPDGTPKDFKYTVTLTSNSAAPTPQPVDPRIVNN